MKRSLVYSLFTKSGIAVLLLAGASFSSTLAADVYVLPQGAGDKSGSSWDNALPGMPEDINAAWGKLAPGDALKIGSGTYPNIGISCGNSGAEGKAIRLEGVDRGGGVPLFTSGFNKADPGKTGGTFFTLKSGASHIEVSNVHLKGYKTGVFLRGNNVDVRISKLNIEQAREGIRSEAGATVANPDSGTHNVTVSDCRFFQFTKRAVRLQDGNYRWRVERCFADAGGKEWGTESFPICYAVSYKSKDKVEGVDEHDIEFIDCVAQNCYYEGTAPVGSSAKPASQQYWNGDGFCSETGVKNLRFVRCVSMHNTDGGWDLKADAPEFIDCVSIDNKENYRLWSRGVAKMTNCISAFAHKRGGSGHSAGLWVKNCSLDAKFCTFIGNEQMDISTDKGSEGIRLAFKDSIFAGQTNAAGVAVVQMIDSVHGADPRISAAKGLVWTAGCKAFDSAAYGMSKGFNSGRWGK